MTSGSESKGVVVGAAGGMLTLADGSLISIPAGALSADVSISATQISPATLPGGGVAGGPAYLLEPEGQQFKLPITIVLTISPGELPQGVSESDLVVLTTPASVTDHAFLLTTTAVDATHVLTQTTHFSDLWVGATNTASVGTKSTMASAGGAGGTLVCFTGCASTGTTRDGGTIPEADGEAPIPGEDAASDEDVTVVTTPPTPDAGTTTPPPVHDAGTTPPPVYDAGTTPPPVVDAGNPNVPDAGTCEPCAHASYMCSVGVGAVTNVTAAGCSIGITANGATNAATITCSPLQFCLGGTCNSFTVTSNGFSVTKPSALTCTGN